MTERLVHHVGAEHSEHCSCRLLAQTVSLDPHLVSYEYCHRVLQQRWHMQCRHGQHMNDEAAEAKTER